jgi:hypothetical protein
LSTGLQAKPKPNRGSGWRGRTGLFKNNLFFSAIENQRYPFSNIIFFIT